MRLIDADALTEKYGDWYIEEGTEEGFIGTLGQLLSVQPDTTTYDSIPAETGKNDGDGITDDLISRRKAFEYFVTLWECIGTIMDRDEWEDACITTANEIPSAQPEIIRCKDCVYQTESWIGIKYCEAHGDHIGKDYDYCSNARRKENGQTDFTASCD